ncbi:MAG: hypothetical protein HY960_08625 [Ignavibacteriae bacterium]|nr:hypothetical protein [Ignavibacteriota bacterium]
MNIQARKLHLIDWLVQVQDNSVLEKIEKLKNKAKIKAYESKLKPMSSEEFLADIHFAEVDLQQRRLMSHEEFVEESSHW